MGTVCVFLLVPFNADILSTIWSTLVLILFMSELMASHMVHGSPCRSTMMMWISEGGINGGSVCQLHTGDSRSLHFSHMFPVTKNKIKSTFYNMKECNKLCVHL